MTTERAFREQRSDLREQNFDLRDQNGNLTAQRIELREQTHIMETKQTETSKNYSSIRVNYLSSIPQPPIGERQRSPYQGSI